MNSRVLSPAALAIFGAMLAMPAIAEDRTPSTKPEAAAAVFGGGAGVVSLDDKELAGHSGARRTHPGMNALENRPDTPAVRVVTPGFSIAPAPAPNNQPTVSFSGQATMVGAQ